MPEQIEKAEQFTDDPQGWARRWAVEFAASRKALEEYHKQGDDIVARFLDDRQSEACKERRLNLFTANVHTQESMLYGEVPRVTVKRRFADAADDVARVGGEMLERILNTDIEKDSDDYQEAVGLALQDRLLPGMGAMRMRYVAEFQTVPETPAQVDQVTGLEIAPAVPEHEEKAFEAVESNYLHWKDQLWSPSRFFREVRWWAFRTELTRDQLVETFGEDDGSRVPLNRKKSTDGETPDPWGRANVWEIWDKENRCCWWYVEGYERVLTPVGVQANPNGSLPDPLGLDGFWPFPRPMVANLTTSKLVPRADFVLAQDQYNEIDNLKTRIGLLTDAIRVVGAYDKTASSLRQMLEGSGNRMVPVDNWAMFAEKGGIKGQVDWFPLDVVVAARDKLRESLQEEIALSQQITGMSDIMRGEASAAATATEQSIKARFASTRMKRFQKEVARFCRDSMRIKAEIIAKHFDVKTILAMANAQFMPEPDRALAQQAAEFIKSDLAGYRIDVDPDSVSLTDYAALKQERGEAAGALQPLLALIANPQTPPQFKSFLLELAKFVLAGLHGASSIEGPFDQAIEEAKKAAEAAKMQPPQQDHKMQLAMAKGQMDLKGKALDIQAKQVETQAKVIGAQADIAKVQAETQRAQAEERLMWGANSALVPPQGGPVNG